MPPQTKIGVPPALPGRQQKFDISGGRLRRAIDETPNREPPSTRTGVPSMDDYESLSHTKWECKYHVVFIPSAAGRRCIQSCDGIWGMCSESWLSRRKAGS